MPWGFFLGLGLFLAAGAAALCVGSALARRRPADGPSLEIVALACAGIFGVLFLFQNILANDALWYYSHLRSAIVDGDLDLYDELVLHNPHGIDLPLPGAAIAPLGAPILSAPAALAVRPIAAILAREGAVPGWEGYEPLDTAAVTWTALLAALGGVALTHRFARTVAGGAPAAIAVTALLYASPLAFFTFVWPGHPHAASVFLGAVFLCVWKRDDGQESPWRALLLGLLGGVLALVAPHDAVYLGLPLVDSLARAMRPHERIASLRSCALLCAGALIGFSPQWVARLATSGGSFVSVNGDASIVTWTPLCAVGAAGILLLRRSHPRLFRGLLLLVVLEGAAIASRGEGPRAFLSAWPALAIGLAVAIERLARRVGSFAAGLATVPFVYWNLLLMAQLRLAWISHDHPSDLPAVMARQLGEAPGALVRGLCGASGWNQVALVEQLRAAVELGSLRAVLVWLAALAIAACVVAFWMKWLATDPPGNPRSYVRPALLLCGGCALAALCVGSVAHDHGRTRLLADVGGTPFLVPRGAIRALALESPGAVPWRADAKGDDPSRLRLDLVSFLHHAAELEPGTLAALIDVHGPGCSEVSLPVRAGFETAERSPGRHASLASWPIAPGCRPNTVLVRVERTGAEVEVLRLSLALFAPG